MVKKRNYFETVNKFIDFEEYKCNECGRYFYSDEQDNNCPHCGNECDDDVMANGNKETKYIVVKLNRKIGNILIEGKINIEI